MQKTRKKIWRYTGKGMLVLFGMLVYGCIPPELLVQDPSIGEPPPTRPPANEVATAPPTIELFEANPPTVIAGDSSTLRWRTRNAASVHLSGVGPVPANGEHVLKNPGGNHVLTATDSRGRSVSESRMIATAYLQVVGPQPPGKVLEVEKPKVPTIKQPKRPITRPNRPSPSIATAAFISLPAPALLSPRNGARFNKFPRRTTLRWKPVKGASRYGVEIDCYNCCKARRWCTDVNKTYKKAPSLSGTTYTFNFAGAQPGRWRVWAIDSKGRPGKASAWRNFSYTR